MMRPRRSELHTLAGAYALDAVSGADRARFERHLAGCRACARELQELREATISLAAGATEQPPSRLIERTVAAAARMPQLPPVAISPPAWAGARRWLERRGLRLSQAMTTTLRSPRTRAVRPRLALALVIIFVAATAAAGLVALKVEHQFSAVQRRDQEITQVLNAPDAVMLTARISPAGTATIVLSRHDRALVFTTEGLPLLPHGRCYELWLMGPAGERSAGMLPAAHDGMTSPVFAAGLAAADWAGLTVEPDGGTAHPTSAPILMLNLATANA